MKDDFIFQQISNSDFKQWSFYIAFLINSDYSMTLSSVLCSLILIILMVLLHTIMRKPKG